MATKIQVSMFPFTVLALGLFIGIISDVSAERLSPSVNSTRKKILFAAPIGTKSQMSFNGEFVNILAERGHQVTLITSYPARPHPNLREIDVRLPLHEYMPNNFQSRGSLTNEKLNEIIPVLCSRSLANEEVRNLNISEFDVVVLGALLNDNDCFLSKLEKTKVPLILASPVPIDPYLQDVIGNPQFPSFVADVDATGTHPFSLQGRITNLYLTMQRYWSSKWTYLNRIESICKEFKHCEDDMEPLRHISRRASLVFVNSVQSLEVPPRPYVAGVVHVGCLNCRPAQPLPNDLNTWVESSEDAGFIYMSLGTVVNPADMPPSYLRILVNVFEAIPQRVLWKWDKGPIKELPNNVKLVTWAPQQDILGHPKLKVFITQGGAHSTLEATYHAAPVLGLPVFFDQISNVDKVVREGWGEVVDWDDLSEDLFKEKLQRLITDRRYRETAQRRSLVMRDQPYTPQTAVAYWTEYVIRHKGAPHLHTPIADMNWVELYNIDVWIAVVLLSTGAVTIATMVAAALCRKLISRMGTKKQKKI